MIGDILSWILLICFGIVIVSLAKDIIKTSSNQNDKAQRKGSKDLF